MIVQWLFVLLVYVALPKVTCYPSGAPSSACNDLTPTHGTLSQSSPCPFELSLSAFQLASSLVYTPGDQYQLTLNSKSGNTSFKGFLIQARGLYQPSTVKGDFINLPNNTQYLTCSGLDSPPYQGVVTHDNPMKNDFYSISLTWVAPSATNGPLTFVFTVVQSLNVFWTNQVTEIIQEVTNPYLLLANQYFILRSDLNGNNMKNVLTNQPNAIGLDYHYRKNYMFWSNPQLSGFGSIKRSYLDGSAITTTAYTNIISPSSIAVDWVNDKIYWSDENTSRIEVAELSGSHRKTLIATDLQYPRALVVDPLTRYIFWVDWGTDMIERASMDGSDRRVIISSNLLSPVSLTLDYSSQTLYWIDRDGTLESSSIDGAGRTLLLSTNTALYQTFGMAYYDNQLYWTERKDAKVYSTPINNPNLYMVLFTVPSYTPYQLQVVHPFSQPAAASNPCAIDNGGCDQLCLLSATSLSGYSCACSDGFLPTDSFSTQCTEAPVFSISLCLSGDVIGQEGCSNWISDEPLKKLFRVGYDIVNGMNDICQCGMNSSNLLSTEYFSFTCDPANPITVSFDGYIYGFSLTNNVADLMDIYDKWTMAISPVDVFGDILYTGQCRVSGSTSPPNTTESDSLNLGLVLGVTLGSSTAIVFLFCGACLAYCFCCQHKHSQTLGRNKQHNNDFSQMPDHNQQYTTNLSQMPGCNEQYPVNYNQMYIQNEQYAINYNQIPGNNEQYTITGECHNQSVAVGTSFPPTYTEAAKMPYYNDVGVEYYKQEGGYM